MDWQEVVIDGVAVPQGASDAQDINAAQYHFLLKANGGMADNREWGK